ncbi:MAG: SGNH/GDSL hydrolase family protein, partial [Clostridia bacterium]|nr:SGNH/GDSL hydrolase family protein [Clostridia bacterium]
MKKRHLRAWGAIVVGVVLGVTLLLTAQALLIPHGASANAEMQLMRDYMHAEDVSHDEVIFLGDCEVYESFSPVTLWQEYGIESRVIGTPQQLLWHSYAALAEALERSSPRLVVLSVYALVYDEPQSEAYNRMALDALPHSQSKWESVRASLTEGESALSYLLPILRYHDRWSELTWSDVTALFESYTPVSSRGYLVQTEVVSAASPLPNHEGALPPPDTAFGETALAWLDRI